MGDANSNASNGVVLVEENSVVAKMYCQLLMFSPEMNGFLIRVAFTTCVQIETCLPQIS